MKKATHLLSCFMALLIAVSAVMICTPQAGAAMLPNVSRSAPIKAYALKSSGRIQEAPEQRYILPANERKSNKKADREHELMELIAENPMLLQGDVAISR